MRNRTDPARKKLYRKIFQLKRTKRSSSRKYFIIYVNSKGQYICSKVIMGSLILNEDVERQGPDLEAERYTENTN